jgi:Flp pilus assembly protein TadB
MSILKDVLSELFSMFVSDARLTAAIFAMVVIAAALIDGTALPPLAGGIALLAGCIAVLIVSVRREARRRKTATVHPPENS